MRSHRNIWYVLLAVSSLSSAAAAQERDLHGKPPLSVEVVVASAAMRGDTTVLTYTVSDRVTSGEDLWVFMVDAPAPLLDVERAGDWTPKRSNEGYAVAKWRLDADELLHPGQTTPQLRLSATGLPDTVHYWAIPDLLADPPLDDPDDPRAPHGDPYRLYADSGLTIGVGPLPADRSKVGLLSRLGMLLTFSCAGPSWITNRGVCESLQAKLGAATRSIGNDQPSAARGELNAFVHELEAQHGAEPGKHVADSAYWLLRLNAEYIISRL